MPEAIAVADLAINLRESGVSRVAGSKIEVKWLSESDRQSARLLQLPLEYRLIKRRSSTCQPPTIIETNEERRDFMAVVLAKRFKSQLFYQRRSIYADIRIVGPDNGIGFTQASESLLGSLLPVQSLLSSLILVLSHAHHGILKDAMYAISCVLKFVLNRGRVVSHQNKLLGKPAESSFRKDGGRPRLAFHH